MTRTLADLCKQITGLKQRVEALESENRQLASLVMGQMQRKTGTAASGPAKVVLYFSHDN